MLKNNYFALQYVSIYCFVNICCEKSAKILQIYYFCIKTRDKSLVLWPILENNTVILKHF
jgi:hypothetical protein